MLFPTDVNDYYSFGKEACRVLFDPTLRDDEFSFMEMVTYGCLSLAAINGHATAADELSKICSNPKSHFYNIDAEKTSKIKSALVVAQGSGGRKLFAVDKYYSFGKEACSNLFSPTLGNDEFSFMEMVAYGCLSLAAINGHAIAACKLSTICSNPKSRFYNIGIAEKLMKQADEGMLKQVEQDHSLAFDAGYAYMYYSDHENLEKAESCFQIGAEQDASCVWELGEIAKKQGKKEKAFNLFMEAAKRGQGMAMYEVGQCFEKGEGTSADRAKAIEWYRRCVESKYAASWDAKDRLKELTGE